MERNEKFTAADGVREITLTPTDESLPSKVVTVVYGEWKDVDKEGNAKPTVSRFEVTGVRVIDGIEVPEILYAPKAAAAIDRMINKLYAAANVTHEDVTSDADLEGDEFYSQSIAAPKPITDNVWKMEAYKDKLDELSALRGEAEGLLESAAASENVTEDQRMAFSKLIRRVHAACGGKYALMQSWAKGATKEAGSNMPMLAALGNGRNALTEAMVLSGLTDMQMRVKPVTTNGGKALERHKSLSVDVIADVAGRAAVKSLNGEHLTLEGMAVAIRRAAQEVGVKDAMLTADGDYLMGLDEVVEAFDAETAKLVVQFEDMYGKGVSMYDKDAKGAALIAYGSVTLSSGGEGLVGKLYATINELAANDNDAEVVEKITNLSSNQGNLFVKKATEAARKQAADLAKSKLAKDVMENTEGDADVTEIRAKLGELSAEAIAARVYKVLDGHAQAGDAWKALQKLVSSRALENDVEPVAPIEDAA